MEWWSMTPTEVLKKLRTEERTGLSENEAQKRLETDGRNRTEQGEGKKGFRRRFLAQFNDFMILLLIGAAVASVAISYWNGEKDFLDAAIILAIVALNAFLGVLQESRAEKALEALKALSAPKASVLRNGEEKEIPAEEVVQGDILLLAAGDYICADGRILENQGLKTEESAITGEALAIEKEEGVLAEKTLPGDRKNMVLAGSYVLAGRGTVAVTATGMATEIGQIAALLAEQEERETPLQKKLGETGKLLGMGALIICGIIFGMGLLRRQPPFPMFMTSVSLAVAAIPEGLPAIVTIVLAIGMQRMARKNTIIRRLPAVETLGSAEVICSDKTGTLTQNRMKVTRLAAIGKGLEQDEEKRRFILTLFTLCNDVKRQGTKIIGEPTEKALAEAAEEGGVSLKGLWEEMPRIGGVPFSSERKLMTTVHPSGGKWISVTKGAPDILFEKCAYCLDGGRQAVFDGRRKSEARLEKRRDGGKCPARGGGGVSGMGRGAALFYGGGAGKGSGICRDGRDDGPAETGGAGGSGDLSKGRDSSCDDYGRSCADSTGDCRRAWDLPCRGYRADGAGAGTDVGRGAGAGGGGLYGFCARFAGT